MGVAVGFGGMVGSSGGFGVSGLSRGGSIKGFRGRHTPLIGSHTISPPSSGGVTLLSQTKSFGHPLSSFLFTQILSDGQLFLPQGL